MSYLKFLTVLYDNRNSEVLYYVVSNDSKFNMIDW